MHDGESVARRVGELGQLGQGDTLVEESAGQVIAQVEPAFLLDEPELFAIVRGFLEGAARARGLPVK